MLRTTTTEPESEQFVLSRNYALHFGITVIFGSICFLLSMLYPPLLDALTASMFLGLITTSLLGMRMCCHTNNSLRFDLLLYFYHYSVAMLYLSGAYSTLFCSRVVGLVITVSINFLQRLYAGIEAGLIIQSVTFVFLLAICLEIAHYHA